MGIRANTTLPAVVLHSALAALHKTWFGFGFGFPIRVRVWVGVMVVVRVRLSIELGFGCQFRLRCGVLLQL